MPYGFAVSSVSVSGTLQPVASAAFKGIGPCRLYIKNTGSQALTACKVQIGPDSTNVYDFDTTTFASLAAGAMLSLALPSPVSGVKVLATCAGGTTLSAWMDDDFNAK